MTGQPKVYAGRGPRFNIVAPMEGRTLSPREQDIMVHVAAGDTSRQIASGFGISPQTVKTSLTSIFRKLGARNRVHAGILWLQRGGSIPIVPLRSRKPRRDA